MDFNKLFSPQHLRFFVYQMRAALNILSDRTSIRRN